MCLIYDNLCIARDNNALLQETYEDKKNINYDLSQNLLNYIVLQMQVTCTFVHRSLKIDRTPF